MALLAALALGACRGAPPGDRTELVRVPHGASFSRITDSLAVHGLVGFRPAFRLYARVTGADRAVKAGTYRFARGASWARILGDLRAGHVVTERLVIPEAWDLAGDAPRIARITRLPTDSVLAVLSDTAAPARYGVPGPTLEGYLYPATYTLPVGVPLDTVLEWMTRTYKRQWTAARRARADSLGFSERDVVTLASIVEREAKQRNEMPLIASVYENRLRRHMALQADPTVQYALGGHRERLVYAAIDSVADDPYNTYTHPGLPPGPIASPSSRAIDAVLHPDSSDFLYFVATPLGNHVFSRTLAQHNAAKRRIARDRRAAERRARADSAAAARRARADSAAADRQARADSGAAPS